MKPISSLKVETICGGCNITFSYENGRKITVHNKGKRPIRPKFRPIPEWARVWKK